MKRNKKFFSIVIVVLALLLIPTIAFASGTGPELIFPSDYSSCEPVDAVTVTGVPKDFYVVFEFFNNGIKIGEETVTSTGGDVSVNFPYGDLSGSFGVVAKLYRSDGFLKATFKGEWKVICEQPSGFQGCTPGYWKQKQHFDSWVGFSTSDNYFDVFGVGFDKTLLAVLKTGGGGAIALGRHSVAALLNASNPDVGYAYSQDQVKDMVSQAFLIGDFERIKNLFEYQNELGCPLN